MLGISGTSVCARAARTSLRDNRAFTGFATTGPGASFALSVADKTLYNSPQFSDYPYKKAGDPYSPAVSVSKTALGLVVPKSGLSRVEFNFTNTGRNVQLLLPMNVRRPRIETRSSSTHTRAHHCSRTHTLVQEFDSGVVFTASSARVEDAGSRFGQRSCFAARR